MLNWQVVGQIDINVLLAFGFGVLFLTVMLIFAVAFPNPSTFAQWVFIVLAVASAGVGAVIPGMLNVDLAFAKAGGALALFVLVYATKPAIVGAVANLKEPKFSPMPTIMAYLAKIDAGSFDEGWEQLDDESKRGLASDRDQYRRLFRTAQETLGIAEGRTELGMDRLSSPSGYPLGIYTIVNFKTRFSRGECHLESVSARATNELQWKVYAHQISPQPIPC